MIVSIFLKYFKTYQGINYVPITDEDHFCGLVGENGIGKSSVLEALDCVLNDKPWNFNTVTKKSGLTTTKPHILPIFLVKKDSIRRNTATAEIISNMALSIEELDVSSAHRPHIRKFIDHRNKLIQRVKVDEYYLLPLGIDHDRKITLFFFECEKLLSEFESEAEADSMTDDQIKLVEDLFNEVKSGIEYIYIPKEIDPEAFTKLETSEIQVLMGETLNQILSERVKPEQITDINTELNNFLNTLSDELEIYSYRTPTDRQQNLKRNDVYNLIIEAFFNIRKLHKKQGENWLEISSLSSGEKQKAIIDVAHSLLTKHRENGNNLIIAVDEPESSLHMSACFEQFDSLYEISRNCMQVIFSSHWYGYLPTIESGSTTIITKTDGNHNFDQINLANYREQIRQLRDESRGRLPYDIRLKSINDFVQSVVTSCIGSEPYNWLICEGSSERIYLSHYLSELIDTHKLRIVPVGGAPEIKKLYRHLLTSYEDFKNDISGKIILISDTDENLVDYQVQNEEKLICKRIVNCSSDRATKLVLVHSNPKSPATDIETALNGKVFFHTLQEFKDEYSENLQFLDRLSDLKEITEDCSYYALDLLQAERDKLKDFFGRDNNKFKFAETYIKKAENTTTPAWIEEIKGWIRS